MATGTDPLDSIIGDAVRVKLLRVFALNQNAVYTAKEFAKIIRKKEPAVRSLLRNLERDGVVKKKRIPAARRKSEGIREMNGYGFNKRYPHREFLTTLVRNSMPTEQDVLAKRLARVPGVECIITVDVFVDQPTALTDVIIAFSQDSEMAARHLIRDAEKTVGRELRCVFLSVNDLIHRIQVNDRFIRGILDGAHRVHLDKQGIFEG